MAKARPTIPAFPQNARQMLLAYLGIEHIVFRGIQALTIHLYSGTTLYLTRVF